MSVPSLTAVRGSSLLDAAQNAFSTRRIRPGRLSFRFPPGHDLQSLVGRLAEHGWWGEIVGPHGSGKSTLLEGLLPLCASAGRQMERFQLRSDQPRLEITADQRRRWSERTLVVVDGYEQLSYFARWRLKRWCRRRSAGLLVTSHQTVGLPLLLHTKTSSGLLRDLVSELVAEAPEAWRPNDVEIDEVFVRSGGNLREALLSLYDVYQRRQRGSSPSSP